MFLAGCKGCEIAKGRPEPALIEPGGRLANVNLNLERELDAGRENLGILTATDVAEFGGFLVGDRSSGGIVASLFVTVILNCKF